MKKVLVLGAGLVSKPLVDYFIDRCGYQVVVATRTVSKADKIIDGRSLGSSVQWTTDDLPALDQLVKDADLVVSMIPPTMHIPVAKSCIENSTNMVTTSYISPEMAQLDTPAREKGILILNEIGEDPGMDHMGAKKMIDEIHEKKGRVLSLASYGAGLPSFDDNRNPFGYKFSWSPRGVMLAAQTDAAYLDNGKTVSVSGKELFDHHWLVDIKDLGTFETYPNRDSRRYLPYFELGEDVSFYRGLLRFTGYCNTMKAIAALGLLELSEEREFGNSSYADFTASLVGASSDEDIIQKTSEFLQTDVQSDVILKLKWLGFFSDTPVEIKSGSNIDLLLDLMLKKMSYAPGEKDMIIVHDEIVAQFPDRREKWYSTMRVEGIPHGDSAMSRAVSLPAAIASKHILEGRISETGVHMPTIKQIYEPVLKELETFDYTFKHSVETVAD